MDPITASLIIGGGLQLWGGLQEAELIGYQADLQQNINELNAQYIELDALEVEKAGVERANQYQAVVDQVIGQQRAGFAANNIDVNYGTAAELQEESELHGFLNALDIKKAARNQARGLRLQASNVRLGNFMQQLGFESAQAGARIRGITGAAGAGTQAAFLSGYGS